MSMLGFKIIIKLKLGLQFSRRYCYLPSSFVYIMWPPPAGREREGLGFKILTSYPATIFCLHHVATAWGQGKGRVRFQNNNNLKLCLARRHTVWAIVHIR